MARSLISVVIPAALAGILLGCGKQDQPPPAPEPVKEAKAKSEPGKDSERKEQPGEEGKASAPNGEQKPSKDSQSQASASDPGKADPGKKPEGAANSKPAPADFAILGLPQSGSGGVALGAPGGGKPTAGYAARFGAGGAGATPGSTTFGLAAGTGGRIPPAGPAPLGLPLGKAKRDGGEKAQVQNAIVKQLEDTKSTSEQYGVYRENEFRSPLVAPLSTFSADVNTASYANVRRMLASGAMPIKDSIFLAEFVNYFPYSYAEPKGEDPIEYNLEIGPCPWNRKHLLVRVGVQAYQIPKDKMPPRNLVFLVDTSGSMSPPNRLPLVRQSLAMLVDQLGEKDRVSIVTYAGDSRVALEPTKGSDKDTIKGIVTNLQANGSTNGEGGIKKAYELARQTFIDGGVNRVILCTDGDFNVGVTNQGDLVRMIEDQRRSKVFLTILGFGMGNYKDETLKELANHGNGHHAYIDSIDEAKKVFVDQGGALACVAKDVKFQTDFNPARVAAYRLIGYENRLLKDEDFRNDAKDAGDMGSGHQVTVLYEIIPVGVATNLPEVEKSKYTTAVKVDPKAPDEWLTVKMRYKQPEGETSKELSKSLPGKALG
ncbi:MAG TPA: von Willebrand factor type A domain-containing protein, partial [Gemmata sp.]|nr:von Willebrand factor type A domain-containing protein [Gemmata sp.]